MTQTLTITDNRTGKQYEVPITDGAIRTIALMWTLRALYFFGVSPSRLRRVYADTR